MSLGRILIMFILCWGFVICSAYNALLTSVLAVSKISPILSLENLLESDKYSLLLKELGPMTEIFRNEHDSQTSNLILSLSVYSGIIIINSIIE